MTASPHAQDASASVHDLSRSPSDTDTTFTPIGVLPPTFTALGDAAALAVSHLGAVATLGLQDDSELVRLEREWLASSERCHAHASKSRSGCRDQKAWDAEVSHNEQIERDMIRMRSIGQDGLRAKISILYRSPGMDRWDVNRLIEHLLEEGPDMHTEATLFSILRDVCEIIRPFGYDAGIFDAVRPMPSIADEAWPLPSKSAAEAA